MGDVCLTQNFNCAKIVLCSHTEVSGIQEIILPKKQSRTNISVIRL